ncbi:MAG: hypothetical protein QXD59_02745 [Candidatus Caldarchaeum sp.]
MTTFTAYEKIVGLWFLLVLMAVPTFSQRYPSDLPAEAQQQIDALYAAARMDVRLGRLGVREYDPDLLNKMLDHLDNPNVRVPALHLTELVLRHWDMPPEALTAIDKKIRLIREKELVRDYVIPIQWQLSLLRSPTRQARVTIAKEGLYSIWGQIMNWAIEDLVKMGGEEAKRLLREAQKERERQGLNEHANRIRLGIKRIEVNEELARGGNGDQLEYVWSMFEKHVKEKPGWGNFQFVLWLMDKIEAIGTPDAMWRLKQFYENKANDREYRYAAQEALVRKGEILPGQRQIVSIHDLRHN